MQGKGIYHLAAIFTSVVWGTTFISSKILLEAGLTPASIMIMRFIIAYIGLLPFWRGKLFADTLRDELWMVVVGITGGSMYFLLENSALLYTQASNVAIIIASTPLLTTLAVHLISRQEKANKWLYACSMLSMAGVVLVVYNGEFVLKLNPIGDILTLGAAIMWVIYSIVILRIERRYSTLMITRKIFFYGILTLLPYFLFEPWPSDWQIYTQPVVVWNMLFLGVIASLLCYWLWNIVLKKLGAIRSTNYLYLNPVVAMVTAYIVLDEQINHLTIIGTALILLGVYLLEKKKSAAEEDNETN